MSFLLKLSNLIRPLPPSRTKVRLGRLVTLFLPRRFSSIVEIKQKDGSLLLLDARSRTEAGAFWNGEYDRDNIDFFKVCTSFGSTVFDVGANVGLITIPLAYSLRANGGGKVYAFEPVRANFDRLIQSIRLNDLEPIVTPINIALGDEEGEIEFARESKGNAATGNAMPSVNLNSTEGYSLSKVRITRLDAFAAKNDLHTVDFVKVDIEGAELLFLRGGTDFLQKSRPIIYGEFNSDCMPQFGHTFADVGALIKPWGYRIFAFAHRLDPVEVPAEPGRGNVFLVPEEKTTELLRRVEIARKAD